MGDIKEIMTMKDYGYIRCNLKDIAKQNKISMNKLAIKAGVSYGIILRYCKEQRLGMIDLDVIARLCYILDCGLNEMLEIVQ